MEFIPQTIRRRFGGKRPAWSTGAISMLEPLIAATDEAGAGKAAVVPSSITCGDDVYLALDAVAVYPDRLAVVGQSSLVMGPPAIRWATDAASARRVTR